MTMVLEMELVLEGLGLSVYDENTVYAIHDSQFRGKSEKKEKKSSNGLTKEDFKNHVYRGVLNIN